MKTNTIKIANSFFSVIFIITMVFSSFASLTTTVSAQTTEEESVQSNMFFGNSEEQSEEQSSGADVVTEESNADTNLDSSDLADTTTTTNDSEDQTDQASHENTEVAIQATSQTLQTSSLSIEKLVKNVTDSTDYLEQVEADFGEIVEFKLVVSNTGSMSLTDLYVADVLPTKLIFVSESLSIPGSSYGGDIFSPDGLNISDLAPAGSAIITFRARVETADKFVVGETILTNTATAKEVGGTPAPQDTNTATVKVVKSDSSVPPTPPASDVCKEIKDKSGWYGKYYDYNSTHPNMEEVSSTWTTYYGDPLSDEEAWTADWYDSKYFKLGKVDSNLIFNNNFFPLDSISGAEIINGHNYHFGVHWKAKVTASTTANYAFQLNSDDDAWIYVDGNLITDNRGVHSVVSSSNFAHLTKGDHIVDIFFAERHTIHSNMYFKFNDTSLVIVPFVDGCNPVVNTPPTITLVGNNPLTLTVGDVFVDPGATATDAQDGNLTSSIVKTGTVNTSTVSTSTLTYSVTDSGGLSASTTRVVVVKAKVTPPGNGGGGSTNTPPVITLIGNNPLNIFIGSTFVDPGATATDAQDGNLTPNIIVSGTVATSTLGTSTLTYSVYDSGGLGATTTRDVVVVATTTPPVTKPQCSDGLDNDGDGKIDSLDPGCHSDGNVGNDSSFDPNDDSEVDVPSNPPSGGGGNGGGGGGSSSGGRRRDVSNLFSSGGEILGASSCSYLRDYLRIDWANDKVEVLKLQSFLNIYNGANLSLTGVFDQNTLVAVNNFQNKYESDILTPWGHDAPTGFVYILTKKKINEIYCNTVYPLTSEQTSEINNFRNFLESLKINNPGASYDASGIGGDLEGAIKDIIVLDQNGEVVDLVSSTGTEDLVRGSSFSSSVLRNAAVSIFAVPDSSLDTLRCFIAFLIILLVMYIVSGILTNGKRERRIVFLILSVIAIIISILVNFYCVVAPLLLAAIISALLILLDKDNDGDNQKTETEIEVEKEPVVEINKNKAPENLPIKEEISPVIEMPGEIVVESDEEEVFEPALDTEKTKN